jgi:hypothetical protein
MARNTVKIQGLSPKDYGLQTAIYRPIARKLVENSSSLEE